MLEKRSKIIIGSLLTVLLATSFLTVGTYSLLNKNVTIHNHIETGNLKMKLTRSCLNYSHFALNGYEEVTVLTDGSIKEGDIIVNPEIDFTNDTSHSIFSDLNKSEYDIKEFAPGLYREATMRLYSETSIAFNYYLDFKFNDSAVSDETLAKQLLITFESGNYKTSFTLDKMTKQIKEGGEYIDLVTATNRSEFSVRVDFLNDEDPTSGLNPGDNNKVENKEVTFDIVVHAVQALN